MRRLFVLVGMVVCAAAMAQAQVKPRHVPPDATAVAHVDLKELNASPMGAFIRQSLDDNARRGLAWLQSMAGINLTNDVDAIVAYATGKLQTTGVVQVAYGRFDVAKLTAVAGGAKEFQNKALGERSLLSWAEGRKRRHLCFVDPTMVLLAWDEAHLVEAVARIDRTAGVEEGESPFAQVLSRKKGRFVAAQVTDVAGLADSNPKLQMFRQAEAALLEISQMDETNGVSCALAVKTPSKELATQLGQAAQGLQALFLLQAAQNPEAAEVAQGVKVALQEDLVTVTLKLKEESLQKMVQVRLEQRRAADAARRAARKAAREPAGEGEAVAEKKPERPAF